MVIAYLNVHYVYIYIYIYMAPTEQTIQSAVVDLERNLLKIPELNIRAQVIANGQK